MKKILLIISTIFTATTFSQNVVIPDVNFKNELLSHTPAVDLNSDNEIQVSEASAYNGTLTLNSKSIADLTGIEAFTSLTKLYIQYNDLTSLDLSQNTQLTHLFCRTNQLTSLNTSQLVNLEQFNCSWNQITSLDLSSNNSLNLLDFRSNQLTTKNTSNLTNLSSYVCAQNQLTSIDISNNLNLVSFNCNYLNLPTLDVSNNTQLQYLDCWNGILTSIDVSNNPALIRFRCTYNQIAHIDVSTNTLLTDLRFDFNDISIIDISSNNLLENLYLRNTLISVLDISNLTQLEYLGCKNNTISHLDFSNSLNIVSLDIQYNNLSSIDLTGLTDLEQLRVNNNFIDSIDITANVNLILFTAGNNDLRYLDMKNGANTSLNSINIGGGNGFLYCVSVDDSTYSEDNWRTSSLAVANSTVFNGDCETSCYIPIRTFDTISACTEYVINGNVVTNSGNYNDTLASIGSCKDSIVRKTITIITPTTSTDVQSACDSYTWIDGNIYTENNNSAIFTMPNSAGCDSIITLNLSINNPDVTVNQTNETLSADLTGAQYQWIDCSNNSYITGAIMPSYTASENGDYAVEITNYGCVDTSSCFSVNSTGFENFKESQTLFYPNPITDVLNIQFKTSKNRKITIADYSGKVLSNEVTSKTLLRLYTFDFVKGGYIVSVEEDESVKNYKITINNMKKLKLSLVGIACSLMVV